jgi:putative NADH-flavin reductase
MALFAVREDVSLDVLLAHGRRGLRITHDERKRPLSPSGISDADHRAFRYANAVHDDVFELKRRDPFASGLDDVLDAIGDTQIASGLITPISLVCR